MEFSPYVLPAAIALLAKAVIFFYARSSKVHDVRTQLYLLCLFALSIQNLTEIQLFFNNAKELVDAPEISGTIYYSASIFALALFLHLTLVLARNGISGDGRLHMGGVALIYAPSAILHALLLAPPLLIAGYEPMGYTYVRVPGPLYPLFQIYAIGYLLGSVALLLYGARYQTTRLRRLQNKYLLVGLIPVAVIVPTVIGLQHLGIRVVNSTVTVPIAVTFFLAVTAYATHQYRLFDIAFFMPWSKVRQRKITFYERIKAAVAEVAEMSSVSRIVQSVSAALNCPVALMGGPRPALAMAGDAFAVARFPLQELKKVDHIIVAQEIADRMPGMHALMTRHKVAAIVPFHPHSEAAASWMLLGENFSEHVYTPLDFQVVDKLFARLADHFLDKQLLLRAQLSEAQREMAALQERLATAWGQLDETRRKLRSFENKYQRLQRKCVPFAGDELHETERQLTNEVVAGSKTLDEQNAAFEARLIERVLDHCDWDFDRAADLLGLSEVALRRKLILHGLLERGKT